MSDQPDPDPESIYSPTRVIKPADSDDLFKLSADIAEAGRRLTGRCTPPLK